MYIRWSRGHRQRIEHGCETEEGRSKQRKDEEKKKKKTDVRFDRVDSSSIEEQEKRKRLESWMFTEIHGIVRIEDLRCANANEMSVEPIEMTMDT